jgi:hypothetical protein
MNELIEKIKALAAEYKALKTKAFGKHPELEEGKLKLEGKKSTKGETKSGDDKTTTSDSALKSNPLEILSNPLVQMFLKKLATVGPSDVKLFDEAAKKALETNKSRQKEGKKLDANGKEVSSYLVKEEMKALVKAEYEAKAKFKNLYEGLDALVKAQIIAEATYAVKAEYKNALGSANGTLEAAAKAFAKFDASLKAFDLKAGVLLDAKFKAEVTVELTAKASGEIQVSAIPLVDILGKVDAEAFARAQASASGQLVFSAKELQGKIDLVAGASVGVKVDGTLSIKSKSGTPLITLKGNASAEVGAKAAFRAKFQIKDGKLIISVNTAVVVGVGTELGGEAEIDFKAIGKLIAAEFKKDPDKFMERLQASFAKIKEKAIEAKDDLEESITKAKAKLAKTKKDYAQKIDKLEDEMKEKAEKMLAKAKHKLEFYEGKMNGIKDEGRTKVLENLEGAKETVAEIQNWLDTKFTSLFD